MKSITTILLIALLSFTSSSFRTAAEKDISVERYVDLLRNGKYKRNKLPVYEADHIDELLKYTREEAIIQGFPVNPFSSHMQEKSRLGIYVLWTIEWIRMKERNEEIAAVGFPSQNPILAKRSDPSQWIEPTDKNAMHSVAKLYDKWWENRRNKDPGKIPRTDPLQDSPYVWH